MVLDTQQEVQSVAVVDYKQKYESLRGLIISRNQIGYSFGSGYPYYEGGGSYDCGHCGVRGSRTYSEQHSSDCVVLRLMKEVEQEQQEAAKPS